jgi:hypothetical protein
MLPLSNFLWGRLPELQFVQFPWRWLDVLDLVFAFFVAAAIGQAPRRWVSWIAGIAVFVAIGGAATAMIRTGWWDTADVPATVEAIRSGSGYEGTDEYAPVGSDRYELPGNPDDTERVEGVSAIPAERIGEFDSDSGEVVPAADVKLHIEQWSAELKEFDAETAMPVTLAVKLVNYPAWEVRLDGQEILADRAPDTGQMLVDLPEGAHRVSIIFRRTWDRTAGAGISSLSACALLAFAFWFRKRSP